MSWQNWLRRRVRSGLKEEKKKLAKFVVWRNNKSAYAGDEQKARQKSHEKRLKRQC